MESQTAVAQYKYKGINVNVWHPVTHIQEYLNLGLSLLSRHKLNDLVRNIRL